MINRQTIAMRTLLVIAALVCSGVIFLFAQYWQYLRRYDLHTKLRIGEMSVVSDPLPCEEEYAGPSLSFRSACQDAVEFTSSTTSEAYSYQIVTQAPTPFRLRIKHFRNDMASANASGRPPAPDPRVFDAQFNRELLNEPYLHWWTYIFDPRASALNKQKLDVKLIMMNMGHTAYFFSAPELTGYYLYSGKAIHAYMKSTQGALLYIHFTGDYDALIYFYRCLDTLRLAKT